MFCKYNTENRCELLTTLVDQNGFYVPDSWCSNRCWPNNPDAQIAMLKKLGVDLPTPPEGKDLLEWAKEKIADGTIKVKQPKPKQGGCPGCGKVKNILRGFAELAKIKFANNQPPDFAVKRGDVCIECEHRTFLNVAEWGWGFAKKGVDLPINHNEGRFDVLWCSKCKCCIAAKMLIESEKCSENKWPERNNII